jgi:hypothetical protein
MCRADQLLLVTHSTTGYTLSIVSCEYITFLFHVSQCSLMIFEIVAENFVHGVD